MTTSDNIFSLKFTIGAYKSKLFDNLDKDLKILDLKQ